MTDQQALEMIKATPGCVAIIDNDCWWIENPKPDGYYEWEPIAQDAWEETYGTLLHSRDVEGCDFGGGLAHVLAWEIGLVVEDV